MIDKSLKQPWQHDLTDAYTDADAQALIDTHAADSDAHHVPTAVGVVPVGGIVLWSGTIASIPSGWALCDGNNSTPDLRDTFIVGAKQDDSGTPKTNLTGSLTATGGAVSHHHADHVFTQPSNHDALGTHTSDGAHTHDAHTTGNAGGSGTSKLTGPATHSSDGGHTHDAHPAISAHAGGAVDTHDTLSAPPPYYALAYIMRTA